MPPVERELQTHATALRSLARDLVGNADADDLVQETALRALRSPPAVPGGLGGFFATILRRLAGTHRREQRRRLRREQAVARHDTAPDASEALAHGEMLQRLTAALMALPQPYRDALLQRYFEGLRPAAIAKRLDLPVATVKTRLQRGLQKLREQLDSEHDGADWRHALMGTLGLGGGAAGLTGVMVMGTGSKLVIGGAAAALAAVVFFTWPEQPPPSDARSVGGVAAVATANGAGDPGTSSPTDRERHEAPTTPVAAAVEPVTIRGRCVDAASKEPLSQCEVRVQATSRERAPAATAAPMTTTADGGFAFSFAPPAGYSITVEARCEGRLCRRAYLGELAAAQVVDLGDIEMIAGARVHGRVVGPKGQALAKCSLALGDLPIAVHDKGGGERIRTRSEDDGTFTFSDMVPAGTWTLDDVGRRGWVQVSPRTITVPPGADAVDVVVTCAPTPSISGRVVDEAGKPVANVDVRPVTEMSGRYPSTTSRNDGSFELFAIVTDPPAARLEITQAEGFEQPPATDPIAWGTRDVRFVLQRGVDIDLHVVERVGQRPVEQFACTAPKERGPFPSREWKAATHSQGHLRLEGLERGRHIVAVMPTDPMLVPGQEVVDVQPGMRAVLIELERLQPRTVIVHDSHGEPVSGAVVEVLHLGQDVPITPRDPRQIWPTVMVPKMTSGPWPASYGKAKTDTRGKATVGLPANDDTLAIRVSWSNLVPVTIRQPTFVADEPMVVTLEPGAVLAGRVLLSGYSLGRAFLVLMSNETSDRMTKVPLAADGSFRVEGLEPGPRVLNLGMDFGGDTALDPPLRELTLRSGEQQTLQLDASAFDGGTLLGRVVVDGAGHTGARTMLRRVLSSKRGQRGLEMGPFPADDAGRFTATGLLPGTFHLSLLVADNNGADEWLRHDQEVVIPAGGAIEREFHFVRHRLAVRLRDAQGKPAAGRKLWVTLPEDLRMRTTDNEGLATFDWMPIGKITLTERADGDKSAQREEVEIAATQTETTVEVQWR